MRRGREGGPQKGITIQHTDLSTETFIFCLYVLNCLLTVNLAQHSQPVLRTKKAALSAFPLWGEWGSILDVLAFGNVCLSYLGCKAAPAVGAGRVVWIFNGRERRQVRHLPSLGQYLLHLSSVAQGLDESLMVLLPVVPSGWLTLQKGNAVRAAGTAASLHPQPCSQGPILDTSPWALSVDVKPPREAESHQAPRRVWWSYWCKHHCLEKSLRMNKKQAVAPRKSLNGSG